TDVHAHGQRVSCTIVNIVGYVIAEAIVTAFMPANGVTVQEHSAVAIDTVKFQPQPPPGVSLGDEEQMAIPAGVVLRETAADRLVAVIQFSIAIKRQFDGPVM